MTSRDEQRQDDRTAAVEVGVISDTHGLLRPEAVAALGGVSLIVHAGDIGGPAILEALARIAPVYAVRGNCDGSPLRHQLPLTTAVVAGEVAIYVVHEPEHLDIDPTEAGVGVVVFGHTHMPRVTRERGVLYLNPGSAGPARFGKPVTLARLTVSGTSATARIVEL